MQGIPAFGALPETEIAIIDLAAGLRGRSRTDFVREPAVRAAKEALMENALIRLSPEGFKAFIAALAGPGQPVAETVGLARRLAPRETSGKGR